MEYIIDFNPVRIKDIDASYYAKIENKIKNRESLTVEEVDDFLDVIGYMVRDKIDPNMDNYDFKCDLAVSILYHYLKYLGCEVFSLTTQKTIVSNVVGHSFLTVKLNVLGNIQTYLVDPTYIQFFRKDKCTKDNYVVRSVGLEYRDVVLLTPDPGFFIKPSMINNARFLLNHGYILLNEDNAQMYGDSFYNTKTGGSYSELKYQTIFGEVYINAFTKKSESVSKTKEELEAMNLEIEPFQSLVNESKRRR